MLSKSSRSHSGGNLVPIAAARAEERASSVEKPSPVTCLRAGCDIPEFGNILRYAIALISCTHCSPRAACVRSVAKRRLDEVGHRQAPRRGKAARTALDRRVVDVGVLPLGLGGHCGSASLDRSNERIQPWITVLTGSIMSTKHDACDFQSVLRSEHDAINRRRARLGRPPIQAIGAASPEPGMYDTIGLALSGGGIRSATVCLGALQALNAFGVLQRVDYLSTVSGGGYIGSCLSATLTCSRGAFVLSNPLVLAQIRDPLNYLFPRGSGHVGQALAIIIRGLVANFAIVIAFLLFSSAITIILHPTRARLYLLGQPPIWLPRRHFSLTIYIAFAGLVFFLLWACRLIRFSWSNVDRTPLIASLYLLLLTFIAFCELQPFLISGLFDLRDGTASYSAFSITALGLIAATAVPIAGIVALFQRPFGRLLKRTSETSNITALATWLPGKAVYLVSWNYTAARDMDFVPERSAHAACCTGSMTVEPSLLTLWLFTCGNSAKSR